MCSAAGVSIPGYSSTLVESGGRVTDHTDGGKPTGYLTMNDKGATIFKDNTRYSNVPCPFTYTTSKTYGRFHIVGTYKATPAEGWVLSELDMNNPEKNAIVFEYTDQEWTDTTKIIDENKHLGANNTTLWAVEWDQTSLQPTTFVAEKNGKYYVVKADSYEQYTRTKKTTEKQMKMM